MIRLNYYISCQAGENNANLLKHMFIPRFEIDPWFNLTEVIKISSKINCYLLRSSWPALLLLHLYFGEICIDKCKELYTPKWWDGRHQLTHGNRFWPAEVSFVVDTSIKSGLIQLLVVRVGVWGVRVCLVATLIGQSITNLNNLSVDFSKPLVF